MFEWHLSLEFSHKSVFIHLFMLSIVLYHLLYESLGGLKSDKTTEITPKIGNKPRNNVDLKPWSKQWSGVVTNNIKKHGPQNSLNNTYIYNIYTVYIYCIYIHIYYKLYLNKLFNCETSNSSFKLIHAMWRSLILNQDLVHQRMFCWGCCGPCVWPRCLLLRP